MTAYAHAKHDFRIVDDFEDPKTGRPVFVSFCTHVRCTWASSPFRTRHKAVHAAWLHAQAVRFGDEEHKR